MARYDRIALLSPPGRAEAFGCWSVLRDLESDDRDPELARRVRIRFLALRPLRRVLDHGSGAVSGSSYERQLECVREELGHLPARDLERSNLARFLQRIRDRKGPEVVLAVLELAEYLEAGGHPHGAEEYARTGVELARPESLARPRVMSLLLLARIVRAAGRHDESRSLAATAAETALALGERLQWAVAMKAVAAAHELEGNLPLAVEVLAGILERGDEWGDDDVVHVAVSELCLAELASGNDEVAVSHGWRALRLTGDASERETLLDQLGTAFRRLGLGDAADRCYELIATGSPDPVARVQAAAARASVAAEAGDTRRYGEMRERAQGDSEAAAGAPRAIALMHVELARGALRLAAVDASRDHAREAIRLAKEHELNDVLDRASGLLTALEALASGATPPPEPARPEPGAEARRIAAEVLAFEDALAPASSR